MHQIPPELKKQLNDLQRMNGILVQSDEEDHYKLAKKLSKVLGQWRTTRNIIEYYPIIDLEDSLAESASKSLKDCKVLLKACLKDIFERDHLKIPIGIFKAKNA
ncbi:MAG: hypothetical protein ACE5KE_04505 [Methanosarcinales archaeon]